MKSFIVIATLLALTLATPPQLKSQWVQFKQAHKKIYGSVREEVKRLAIFSENVQTIRAHNELYEQGIVTFEMDINQFGDMTAAEFMKYVNGSNVPAKSGSRLNFVPDSTFEAPESVDWRLNNVVTEVKDQGSCGSCWSFSATGSVEGQYALKNNKLISLSEQNLIDCSEDYGNYACAGGWMGNAFNYISDNGIETEEDYPYEGELGECRFDVKKSVTKVNTYVSLPRADENALKEAVATIGPISAAIFVGDNFRFYKSGYYYDETCSSFEYNHGILVVGYGGSSDEEWWLVKNSWGSSWGDAGYIKMARNKRNNCAIATAAEYPIL